MSTLHCFDEHGNSSLLAESELVVKSMLATCFIRPFRKLSYREKDGENRKRLRRRAEAQIGNHKMTKSPRVTRKMDFDSVPSPLNFDHQLLDTFLMKAW